MTWKPELRFDQHVSGLGSHYTSKHPIKRLAYLEEYNSLEIARAREKQIHGWSRKKKERLISGQWSQNY